MTLYAIKLHTFKTPLFAIIENFHVIYMNTSDNFIDNKDKTETGASEGTEPRRKTILSRP